MRANNEGARDVMSFELESRSSGLVVLESFISVLITGSALFGNVLFCVAFFRNPQLRVSRNYFIMSLAMSDVFMSFLAMPLSTGVFIVGYWPYGEFMCQFQGAVSTFMGIVSLLTLTLTALNRYFKMVKASHLYRKIYSRNSITCMIVGSWLLAAVVPVPYMVFGISYRFHPGKAMCSFNFGTKAKAYIVAMMVLFIAVPFSVIIICYWKVFWKVRKHSRQVFNSKNEQHQSELSTKSSLEEIKITNLLIAIVMVFTICWTPFFVVDLISYFQGDYALPRWIYVVYVNMVASNSFMNPIIYGAMNRRFRQAFLEELFCCQQKELPKRGLQLHRRTTVHRHGAENCEGSNLKSRQANFEEKPEPDSSLDVQQVQVT